MKKLYAPLLVSATTAALMAAAGVSAQTVTRPANPEPVGTTQQKANEAMQKAIPQSNVGTVVRTGTTASAAASAAVTPGTTTTRTTAAGTTVTTNGAASATATDNGKAAVRTSRSGRSGAYVAPRRAARADRG